MQLVFLELLEPYGYIPMIRTSFENTIFEEIE